MDRKIEFSYPSGFFQRIETTRWLHTRGIYYLCHMLAPFVAIIACFMPHVITTHSGQVAAAFFFGALCAQAALFLDAYFGIVKAGARYDKAWHGLIFTKAFDDEGIAVKSALGSGKYNWNTFGKLEHNSQSWLLFFNDEDYLALPTNALSEELQNFIAAKMTMNENGLDAT